MTTTHAASRSMDRARHHARQHEAAYDAGYHGVSWDEHRDHRADPDDAHQKSLHAAHEQGRLDRLAETKPEVPEAVRARLRQRDARIARRRSIAGQTGGYLARAGRSVASHTGEVPTGGGSGTFLGVLVGIAAVILLFVALSHAGGVASFFTGLTGAARWFISPSKLPI